VAVRLGISFFVTIFDELRLRFVGGFKLWFFFPFRDMCKTGEQR
jgi:hypothetical protein